MGRAQDSVLLPLKIAGHLCPTEERKAITVAGQNLVVRGVAGR